MRLKRCWFLGGELTTLLVVLIGAGIGKVCIAAGPSQQLLFSGKEALLLVQEQTSTRCMVVIVDHLMIRSDTWEYWMHISRHVPKAILTPDVTTTAWSSLEKALNHLVNIEGCLDMAVLVGRNCLILETLTQAWQSLQIRGEGRIAIILNTLLPCVEPLVLQEDMLDVTYVLIKNGSVNSASRIKRTSLFGQTLRVGLITYPPFVTYSGKLVHPELPISHSELKSIGGVEYLMLQHMARRFNFSMKVFLRQEGELWGMTYENGSSTGLVGEVKQRFLSIAGGGFNWDIRYFGHVELSMPYRRTLVKFLSPRREATPNWLSLVQPFNGETWGAVFCVIVVGALTLHVAHVVELGCSDLTLSCLVSLSLITQQGDVPKKWQRGLRRRLVVGLQLGALLLCSCYCGLLVAVLTFEPPARQIDTPEQLAHSLLCYTDVDEVWPGQLRLSEDVNIHEILRRFEMSHSWEELKQRLRRGDTAYSIECLDTGFLCMQESMEQDLLDLLYLSREFVLTSEIALVQQKGFPLRRLLDIEILRLLEGGVLTLWEHRVIRVNKDRDMGLVMRRSAKDFSRPLALSLAHLGGPFILLALGLSLASLAFLVEHTCDRRYWCKNPGVRPCMIHHPRQERKL